MNLEDPPRYQERRLSALAIPIPRCLRRGSSFGEQLRGLLKLMTEKSAEDMINQLVFLSAYIRDS